MSNLTRYFFKNKWGGSESLSGKGSTLAYTKHLRESLPILLAKYQVGTFLDAPCGDFHWMKEVQIPDVNYIGMDIVQEIIDDLVKNYTSDRRRFQWGDITETPLPWADLMMCRDCLFHLPFSYGLKFLNNFVISGIPHLLLTSNFVSRHQDLDRPGKWRQVNMRLPPFSLPEPIDHIEDWIEGHPKRHLGLWTRQQIFDALYPPVIVEPRAAVADNFDEDAKAIRKALAGNDRLLKRMADEDRKFWESLSRR